MLKSMVRIVGLFLLPFFIQYAVATLIAAEVLGIIEETAEEDSKK
jgi:hypothetical protein